MAFAAIKALSQMSLNFIDQIFGDDDYEDIFVDFDFKLFDNENFKEDSVREEIVFPILKQLGYTASGENKIIRSKTLKHPFRYFGTTKFNLSIVPDYTFEIDQKNYWILDAKRPTENIKEGKNVHQAYSYASHPEIQADIFALCNGREFSVFNMRKLEPILFFEIKNIKEHWGSLKKLLSPAFVKKPHLSDFSPDLGLYLLRIGDFEFISKPISFKLTSINWVVKIENNLYSINQPFGVDGVKCMGTFDFDKTLYKKLLSVVSPTTKAEIESALGSQPFRFVDMENPENKFTIVANIGELIHSNENESYLPFEVLDFIKD